MPQRMPESLARCVALAVAFGAALAWAGAPQPAGALGREGRAPAAEPGAAPAVGAVANYLVDIEGRAVYVFSADTRASDARPAESACHGACALAWPPVTTEQEPGTEGRASGALVATVRRDDGRLQVTYNGWPLYYFRDDRAKVRAQGADRHAFGGTWRLIQPDGRVVEGRPPAF